ncbi:tetratricopeptide repeat protein [Spirochaeta isovalerica]|uniref:Tetratricopeptide (TPR) repeat protein n=1 Tax=Spirochaeta isovalerica TaxID=150 RepID=A0A841R5V4_9SPIO|nr:hypothetical protein [Spirochaeta isovalerica]MBB6478761.1 tetratricopeptide (TPR) repeat protein [Spirochaeta isovalerica]
MKKIILIFISVITIISCRSETAGTEVVKNLMDAEKAFQNGLEESGEKSREEFFQSAVLYEELLRSAQLNDARILYNTANSFFMAGNIGKAVLYYRMAEKRQPSNRLIRDNLNTARSAVLFKIPRDEPNKLIRTLLFFHYDLSSQIKSQIIYILIFLIFAAASFLLFSKSLAIRNTLIILIFPLILFTGSILQETFLDDEGVIIRATYGRKGDSEGYDRAFNEKLSPGIEFKVLEIRKGWYYIELFDGNTCWISSDSAEIIY